MHSDMNKPNPPSYHPFWMDLLTVSAEDAYAAFRREMSRSYTTDNLGVTVISRRRLRTSDVLFTLKPSSVSEVGKAGLCSIRSTDIMGTLKVESSFRAPEVKGGFNDTESTSRSVPAASRDGTAKDEIETRVRVPTIMISHEFGIAAATRYGVASTEAEARPRVPTVIVSQDLRTAAVARDGSGIASAEIKARAQVPTNVVSQECDITIPRVLVSEPFIPPAARASIPTGGGRARESVTRRPSTVNTVPRVGRPVNHQVSVRNCRLGVADQHVVRDLPRDGAASKNPSSRRDTQRKEELVIPEAPSGRGSGAREHILKTREVSSVRNVTTASSSIRGCKPVSDTATHSVGSVAVMQLQVNTSAWQTAGTFSSGAANSALKAPSLSNSRPAASKCRTFIQQASGPSMSGAADFA
ncbi:hypothetical protein R1flu_002644 [Riccia fluitans]|uniref:Uncharacterized protein n=1 Tax=Riccia fluitans TaxID=41844 RepID=A0ABD1Y6R4_9MARC